MGIVITCIEYSLLLCSLIIFILEGKNKKERKIAGVLEVNVSDGGKLAFSVWIFSFLSVTLFTVDYYIPFFSNLSAYPTLEYFIIVFIFSCFLIPGYLCAHWKIIIKGNKVIKYGIFKKKCFNICDITEMRQGWFGYKYFINGKKIFSTNARYTDYSNAFESFIIKNSGCKVVSVN